MWSRCLFSNPYIRRVQSGNQNISEIYGADGEGLGLWSCHYPERVLLWHWMASLVQNGRPLSFLWMIYDFLSLTWSQVCKVVISSLYCIYFSFWINGHYNAKACSRQVVRSSGKGQGGSHHKLWRLWQMHLLKTWIFMNSIPLYLQNVAKDKPISKLFIFQCEEKNKETYI